jgi:hypothetical protein
MKARSSPRLSVTILITILAAFLATLGSIVLSEHAIGSVWVEEEVDAALDREHQQKGTYLLFPIRLDDQVLQTSKAWAIAVRQRYIGDFRQWTDDVMHQRALQRLLRDLHT